MSDFDQVLLQEFAVEVAEHVDACERVLVRAGTEGVSEDDVHLLFRSFHSVKGLARVLASSGLEKLSHTAESLLATVREGKNELDGPTQTLLLAALDAIKQARTTLIAGAEFHAEEALLVGLEAATTREGVGKTAGTTETGPAGAAQDLYFDHETLIALAELFEELLPGVAARVAADPAADVVDDVDVLSFALNKVGFSALEASVRFLRSRAHPTEYARCLHRVDRLAHVVEHPCGVTEASRHARSWLAPAFFAALDESRWSDADVLLRALAPSSTFVGLLPQLTDASCADDVRTAGLALLREAMQTSLSPDGPDAADLGAMAAERVRNQLIAPHQAPSSVLRALELQKVDVERFRTLPVADLERFSRLAVEPSPHLWELVVVQPSTGDALAELARALVASLDPLAAESMAMDGVRCLALLLATTESEEDLRARAIDVVGKSHLKALRRPDRQPGATHFGVKAKTAVEAPGGLQVRVPVALLDSMFGRVGQFFGVTTRFNALVFDGGVHETLNELSDYAVLHAPNLLPGVERLIRQQNDYAALEAEAHRLISVIHEMTLGLRVIPIDTLFSRFPRMVRDLSQKQSKVVRLEARSNGIRVDNGMLELLADPLVHMVRNSVDHGIEPADEREAAGKPRTATLFLRAEQRGNHVVIEIGDDGRGIDLERVLERAIAKDLVDAEHAKTLTEEQIARFIFSPGFSTAERVTDTSGRGVGMDVALVNVTKLGGVIDIVTRRGQGTTFRIDIPLSKAIQSMLLAETGVQTIAFPDRMVSQCVVVPPDDVQLVNGQRSILLHGRFLPLFRLVELMRLPAPPPKDSNELSIVVCELDGRRVGVEVHRIRRRTDLLIQEVHPRIAKLPGVGGISTLGTDKIVVVVDPEGLFDLARRHAVFGLRTHETRVEEGLF